MVGCSAREFNVKRKGAQSWKTMDLLDELNEKRASAVAKRQSMFDEARKFDRFASDCDAHIADIDKCIAALSPAVVSGAATPVPVGFVHQQPERFRYHVRSDFTNGRIKSSFHESLDEAETEYESIRIDPLLVSVTLEDVPDPASVTLLRRYPVYQSSSQEIPEGFTKLGANVGCNCVNEYQDKHGMRWCCGGDGIVYTLSAQPDPADLPPPTEAEFNALEKLDGIGALDVCEDGTLVDQYDEPAPAVSDLVECVGVFNGLSEPVPDTPDATLTAVAPLAVDYYATRELERSEEREKARGLMEKLFGAKP